MLVPKRYPAYKDSGARWLGEIPTHWEVRRLKALARNINDQGEFEGDAYIALEHVESWTGRVRPANGDITVESQVKRFLPNDILFGKLRPYLAKVTRPRFNGVCVTEFLVLRASAEVMLPEFLEQQLRSKNIIDVVNSSTFGAKMPRADWTFMGDLALGFPPEYSEQSAIVRFLDHVDRRIRRYVRAKRRLIELLNEQKQAIVQRAVTRGLDPNVRLKPSGVEWLGDVPVDWEVSPLKRVARLQRGYDLPDYSRRKGIYPVISSGGIIGTHAVANVKGPGVVMGRYGSTGKIFFVESDFWPHNTALYVQDFQGNLPRYVFHLLHILNYGAHSGKSAVPGVDRKDLHDIQVPIAPILEQTRIIAYLDSELARIDILIEQTNSAIALSLEYRTRLIADVVTGKVDVRDLAASLPDTIEEEIPDDSVVADETDTQDDGLDPSEEATDVE